MDFNHYFHLPEKTKDREWDILKRRYGIGMDPMSLNEISQIYGITREGVRQVEMRALKRLKKSKEVRQFLPMLG